MLRGMTADPPLPELTASAEDYLKAIYAIEPGGLRAAATQDTAGAALTNFVAAERRCCRVLAYELAFSAELGPVVLRLRGDADGKRFVYNAFVPAGA